MNKRTGKFIKVGKNPIELIESNPEKWLCFPAKVGKLIINIYFHECFYEIGFSLCNLFEIADDEDLKRKPDAILMYGFPEGILDKLGQFPTVFYDDEVNDLVVGAIPESKEYGYFGYCKKMTLTLHNIKMMKQGKMPFHGALLEILTRDDKRANILLIGDTGAGKSETLEAFRKIGENDIKDITIIADDMGSLEIDAEGNIIGYGTEIGAFLRMDDLPQGYAFGQMDRSIIMNPSQVNARIILPVTTINNVNKGNKLDFVLYANNYEAIDDEHQIVERFPNVDAALKVFSEGAVMSKGTTTSTGIVHSYFANVFGPPEYKDLHNKISRRYFEAFFDKKIFVGQMRTRLGIANWEAKGPEEAAIELLKLINKK